MAIIDELDDITEKIKTRYYRQETDIVDSVVQRLLVGSLNWPRWDNKIISREYAVENGRPDLVLYNPPEKPIIFIEVKYLDKITDDSKTQLFRYAFDESVSIVILTDGREWNFYLPNGKELFCQLDILNDTREYCAEKFARYLDYENCKSGQYKKSALEDYDEIVYSQQVKEYFPKVFKHILETKDEYRDILLDIIKGKMSNLFDIQPTEDMIIEFLNKMVNSFESTSNIIEQPREKNVEKFDKTVQQPTNPSDGNIQTGYYIDGIGFTADNKSAINLLVDFLIALHSRSLKSI